MVENLRIVPLPRFILLVYIHGCESNFWGLTAKWGLSSTRLFRRDARAINAHSLSVKSILSEATEMYFYIANKMYVFVGGEGYFVSRLPSATWCLFSRKIPIFSNPRVLFRKNLVPSTHPNVYPLPFSVCGYDSQVALSSRLCRTTVNERKFPWVKFWVIQPIHLPSFWAGSGCFWWPWKVL